MLKPFAGRDVQPYHPTVIDIETAPDGTVIAVGFAYELEGAIHYASYDSFSEWFRHYDILMQQYRTDSVVYKRLQRIYAHNGANFDYLALYTFLHDRGLIVDGQYFMADSTGIGVQFETTHGYELYLLDSLRLMPASLDKLSKTFGVANQKQTVPDACKDNYLLFKERYPDLFWNYLRNDVLGLQQVIKRFWEMLYSIYGNIGELPMTLPAVALRTYSKQMQQPMLVPENPELKALERAAYKGGLTLCMKTGVYPSISVYDVNSMYPAMMSSKRFPMSYRGYWTKRYNGSTLGFYRCTFRQNRTDVPPFLFDEKAGAAYEGRGVFSTAELNHLLQVGGEFTVETGYIYLDVGTPFATFVQSTYALRQEATAKGDEALAYTLKILLNSLYGKFAQREQGHKIVVGSPALHKELIANKVPFHVLGDFVAIPEERKVRHVFVGLAAMVTAYARVHLHSLMCDMINAGHSVVYCDTDSVHTAGGTMPVGNALGEVKLEFAGEGAYAGRKIYALRANEETKIRAKGIGRKFKNGSDKITYERIAKLATDKTAQQAYTFDTFPSVKEVLTGKAKPAVIQHRTRRIRNTGGIWD